MPCVGSGRAKVPLKIVDTERNDIPRFEQVAVRLTDQALPMASQLHIGIGNCLDGVRLSFDSETIENAVGVEILGAFPSHSAVLAADRHFVAHASLVRDAGNGLGVVQDGNGIERGSEQQNLSGTLDETLQRRSSPKACPSS